MTSFLTSISGKFSQSLLLGTFAPVTLFLIIGLIVLGPLFPGEITLFQPLAGLESGWQLLALTLLVVVLSLMLSGLNTAIIRFYEGYPWLRSAYGQLRVRYYRDRAAELKRRWTALANLLSQMEDIDKKCQAEPPDPAALHQRDLALQGWSRLDKVRRALPEIPWAEPGREAEKWEAMHDLVNGEYARLEQARRTDYPSDPGLILPTRLGNIIRNFENYSVEQYQMDPIILWPRLTGVIEPGYQALIDEAKTQFDFLLNCSLLCFVLAVLVGLTGLIFPTPAASFGQLAAWLLLIALFLLLAYWFYRQTFSAAIDWGDRVRSAFDLYKDALKKKLGYEQTFRLRQDEQALWHDISTQMYYGRTGAEAGAAPPYCPAPAAVPPLLSVSCTPAGDAPRLTRGIKRRWASGMVELFVQVENVPPAGAAGVPITSLVVSDTLPAGWLLVWDSAWADQGSLSLSASPHPVFTLTGLALGPGARLLLTYRALPFEADEATNG